MTSIWLKNYPQGIPAEADIHRYVSLKDLFEQSCERFRARAAAPVGRLGAVAIVVLEKPRFTVITGVNTLFNRLLNAPGFEKVAATNGGAVGVPDDRSAEAVIAHCRANLAGYKAPKHVAFRDTLPKTSIGKVLRRRLKEEALGA